MVTRLLGSADETTCIPPLKHAKPSFTLRECGRGWHLDSLEKRLMQQAHAMCWSTTSGILKSLHYHALPGRCLLLQRGDVTRAIIEDEKVPKDAKCVIADPIYRRIRRDEHGNLPLISINIPHFSLFAMYRSHILDSSAGYGLAGFKVNADQIPSVSTT